MAVAGILLSVSLISSYLCSSVVTKLDTRRVVTATDMLVILVTFKVNL